MPVKRVMLIRSGETEWNRMGRWQGWVCVPLNEHGKMQAQRLADFLRDAGIDRVYSSDLCRARQTAEIMGRALNIQPIYDPRLRERDIGMWQGLTMDEIADWYSEEYRLLREDPVDYQVPGGESRREMSRRVRAAFEDIVASDGDVVGIVSHSTAIRGLIDELIKEFGYYDVEFLNMSVTTLVRENGDNWKLAHTNDVSHLEGMESQSVRELEASE